MRNRRRGPPSSGHRRADPASIRPRRRRIALCLLTAAIVHGAAQATAPCPADPDWSAFDEMRFTTRVVGGIPVLLAEGRIDGQVIARFREALATFQGQEIWLRSPGGDMRAAFEAGRLIRQLDLKVRIPESWTCAAACTYMLMGGTRRTVDGHFMLVARQDASATGPTARVDGLPDDEINDIARRAAISATEQYDFLLRMGVSPRILGDITFHLRVTAAPPGPGERRCLSAAELRDYRVTEAPPAPRLRR